MLINLVNNLFMLFLTSKKRIIFISTNIMGTEIAEIEKPINAAAAAYNMLLDWFIRLIR